MRHRQLGYSSNNFNLACHESAHCLEDDYSCQCNIAYIGDGYECDTYPAMLLLSTYQSRTELKRSFEENLIFRNISLEIKKVTQVKVTHLDLSARRVNCRLALI